MAKKVVSGKAANAARLKEIQTLAKGYRSKDSKLTQAKAVSKAWKEYKKK